MTAEEALNSLGPEPLIVYDGDCPFCSRYVEWTRLKEAIGTPSLVNARDIDRARLDAIQARYDLDQGMLFAYGGRVYWGADAIHAISLLTAKAGLFNRINAALFRSKTLARLAYPGLRAGRNLALFLKRKKQIAASAPQA